jgi:hypothetical protein
MKNHTIAIPRKGELLPKIKIFSSGLLHSQFEHNVAGERLARTVRNLSFADYIIGIDLQGE